MGLHLRLKVTFLGMLLAFVSQAYAQAENQAADCTDESKTRLLIRKGVMDKNLCLKVMGNDIKVVVTGQLFTLASDNNQKTSSSSLDCKTEVKGQKAENKDLGVTTGSQFPTRENFRKFITFIKDKVKDSSQIKLTAKGYADGVNNYQSKFDSEILNDLPLDQKEAFKKTACTPRSNLKPQDFISVLNPTRNIYLAKSRAQWLVEHVFEDFYKQFPPEILPHDSPALTTGKTLCKGFCTFRRGAELIMTLPGLEETQRLVDEDAKAIPVVIQSLKHEDYKEFSRLAIYTHQHDVLTYIRNNSSNPIVKKYREQLDNIDVLPVKPAGNKFFVKLLLKETRKSNKISKSDLKDLRSAEIDFFKLYMKDKLPLSENIDETNPYLHWQRVLFWVSIGSLKNIDDANEISINPYLDKYNSRRNVKVVLGKVYQLLEPLRTMIEDCESLETKPKAPTAAACKKFRSSFIEFYEKPIPTESAADDSESENEQLHTLEQFLASLFQSNASPYRELAAKHKPIAMLIKKQMNELGNTSKYSSEANELKSKSLGGMTLVEVSETQYDLKESVLQKSITGGSTTSIFNFLNYRHAMLWLLANKTQAHRATFNNFDYTKMALREIKEQEKITAVYMNIRHITTSTSRYKGFYHNLCKTGMVFDMDDQTNDKFTYLSRMGTRKGYLPLTPGGTPDYLYDETYNYVDDAKTPPMTLMKIKHPSAYAIPNCKGCNCIKNLFVSNTESNYEKSWKKFIDNGDKFEALLKNAKYLNFYNGFQWVENPYPKKTDTPPSSSTAKKKKVLDPFKQYEAKNLMTNDQDVQFIPEDYCLFSPIIPQPHEVGVGDSEKGDDSTQEDPNLSDGKSCFIRDILNSQDEKTKKMHFPEVDLDDQAVEDIYNYCSNYNSKIGMPEEECKIDKDQLCFGLTAKDKTYYKTQCAQNAMTVGDKSTSKDAQFCTEALLGAPAKKK